MTFGPPPGGFPPPPPSAWTPPSEVEQALFEAKSREDWAAYFGTLAQSRLFFEIQKDKADATPSATYAVFGYDPRVAGGRIWAVYTEGMLPAPEPHRVFDWNYLKWFAKVWQPTDPPVIVVNPGSPCEAFLPSAPPHSAVWARYGEQAPAQEQSPRLRTLRTGGPLYGPAAHGLACGALLCVNNDSFWNGMASHGEGYPRERKQLREWWGITSREEWLSALNGLLAAESHSRVWDFAMGLRRTIARDFGGHVDVGYWKQSVANVIRANSQGSAVVTEDGVTKTEPRPESEVEACIEGVQRLIGRITRYEARMRADGVLGENQYVSSVAAWDLGRASNMARWGLAARFGTLKEAESAVIQAGRASALAYKSWQDFAAGFILGRSLHFDEEEFGSWYQNMVKAHRILVSGPGSPWLNIPFR
ncbi:DUF1266 domain-containing protein [Streptomyces sp. Caat 7-52]|uniref:DUF1266 domain-containing protein n=1 Tax=Streptomyces sp. Caat 7-52 TaxID=2949637 RepID=UPI0020353F0D|nr:DUF1266 domain-containing protein [Streptomyces sp. Caat 7-52]